MINLKRHYKLLFAMVLSSIIFSTIYTTAQQVLRLDANDPQIQMAEDIALKLDQETDSKVIDPTKLITGVVDIHYSLAPFTIIYDKSGQIIASNAQLNGSAAPAIPFGALQHAAKGSSNKVTWQPKVDIRIASVIVSADKYYVLVGRNLREVQSREADVLKIVTFGWVVSSVLIGIFFWLNSRGKQIESFGKPSKPRPHKK